MIIVSFRRRLLVRQAIGDIRGFRMRTTTPAWLTEGRRRPGQPPQDVNKAG